MKTIRLAPATLLLLALFTGCVSVPMSQITIPQNERDFQGSAALGLNGLDFNLAYSPDARWVFYLAGNGKSDIWTPKSLSAEGGGGWVSKRKNLMLSASYGRGTFRLKPKIGGYNLYIFGTFYKASLGLNARLSEHIGIALRLSNSGGKALVQDDDYKRYYTDNFQVHLGLEGLVYFEPTKQRNFLLYAGASSSRFSDLYDSRLDYEGLTYMTPIFVALGCKFGN